MMAYKFDNNNSGLTIKDYNPEEHKNLDLGDTQGTPFSDETPEILTFGGGVTIPPIDGTYNGNNNNSTDDGKTNTTETGVVPDLITDNTPALFEGFEDYIPYIIAFGLFYGGLKVNNQTLRNALLSGSVSVAGGKIIGYNNVLQNALIGLGAGAGTTVLYNYINKEDLVPDVIDKNVKTANKQVKKLAKQADEIPLPF